jgi:hypothetical protein
VDRDPGGTMHRTAAQATVVGAGGEGHGCRGQRGPVWLR